MFIFVGGISNSGKSFTLRGLQDRGSTWRVLSASGMLADMGRPLRPLSPEEALLNQDVLLSAILQLTDEEGGVLLDGHANIETTVGMVAVPDDWFAALGFAGMIHVEAAPADVSGRRRSRGLPWTEQIAQREQAAERAAIHLQAAMLGVPVLDLPAGDLDSLEKWLTRFS